MTKTEIKKASFHYFATKGYPSTTMQEIAETVGIKKPSLYVHFKNKSDIYIAVLNDQYQCLFSAISKIDVADDRIQFEARLKNLFFGIIDYLKDKDKFLFWKRTALMITEDIEEEIAGKVTDTMRNLDNVIINKISDCVKMDLDTENLSAATSYFMLLILGILDYIFIFNINNRISIEKVWFYLWNGYRELIKH
jgi:AcrR family transcriptional regulator